MIDPVCEACGTKLIDQCFRCGAPQCCPKCCLEEEVSRAEALAEYNAHKAAQAKREEQDECPHDEHDHGICLDCGKDIMDDLVDAAESAADAREDR